MRLLLSCALALSLYAGAAHPQAIAGFGQVTPVPGGGEQPMKAMDYKVLFDISQGGKTPSGVNIGLERAARLVNMLEGGGVPADKRQIATVVYGPATETMLSDAAWGARHNGEKNPNTALIAALQKAGVSVRICGQAMAQAKIATADLAPGVQVDLSAIMTVANLQLQGYAVWSN